MAPAVYELSRDPLLLIFVIVYHPTNAKPVFARAIVIVPSRATAAIPVVMINDFFISRKLFRVEPLFQLIDVLYISPELKLCSRMNTQMQMLANAICFIAVVIP